MIAAKLAAALLLFAPLQAQEATNLGIVGHWTLGYLVAGSVEEQTIHLQVDPPKGETVIAELRVSGRRIPFTGSFDAETGKLELSAQVGADTAAFRLALNGDELRGDADIPGRHIDLTGIRADGEPAPVVAVDLNVRPAARTGSLPDSLSEDCQRAIGNFARSQPVVGLSAAFVVGNEVVEVQSHGWEDYSERTPASAETMYRWASVSKPLTAVLALLLASEGDLDLAADIRAILPEYDKGVAMTAEQLLTHRAAVTHYDQMKVRTLKDYPIPHPWADRVLALDMFVESDLVQPPGTGFHYSTPGYSVLGAVIERAGEGTYAEQMMAQVCRPLGMTSMRPDYIWEEIPHRAAAYEHFGDQVYARAHDDISWKLPAGGWISTVGDMARFGAGIMGEDLLDELSKELMWGPADEEASGYRMGISVGRINELRVLSHSGGQVGTSTYLICSPDSGHAIAVAANTEGIGLADLARQLLGKLLDSDL